MKEEKTGGRAGGGWSWALAKLSLDEAARDTSTQGFIPRCIMGAPAVSGGS